MDRTLRVPRGNVSPPDRVSPVAWIASGRLRGVEWIAAYLTLVAAPLLILLAGRTPKGGGYGWDFAMALGFGGLAMLALQSVLTARFRRATAPFGIDIIYYFHRSAAVAALGLVLGHYLILRFRYADALGPMNPLTAPWQMTAGRLALMLFLVLVVSSLWRKKFHIEYDRWRLSRYLTRNAGNFKSCSSKPPLACGLALMRCRPFGARAAMSARKLPASSNRVSGW